MTVILHQMKLLLFSLSSTTLHCPPIGNARSTMQLWKIMLNQGHQKKLKLMVTKIKLLIPERRKSKRKDKLSSGNLNVAMDDYDAWFWKIVALCTHTKLQDSYLKPVIANHCKTEQDKKAKKMASGICHQNCTELAARYLD